MGANIKKDDSSPTLMTPDFTCCPPMYRIAKIVMFPINPV
jgi:hypothetical protein